MDIEDIKEISKNINIKGEINSETVEKVSKELIPRIMPFVWFREILSAIQGILLLIGVIIAISIIVKGCSASWVSWAASAPR